MAYPEAFYNSSLSGKGFEGLINYSNNLVDGWFVILFLAFVFIASEVTLAKSEWSTPGITAFSFFICLISALILQLFTTVPEVMIFIIIIGMGLSIAWGIMAKGSR